MHISIVKPLIGEEEIKNVKEVLESGMLAQGKVVGQFEREFSQYVSVDHSIVVCNGTVALDLVLKACGVGEGDEVITTPFTFVSTVNSILFQRAKPGFCGHREGHFQH